MLRVLVACEFSGVVRDAFRSRGHSAMSCDLEPTEVAGPHFQGDMFKLDLASYDLVIAHPPCRYLCISGNRYHANSAQRVEAAGFVRRIWDAPIRHLVIENSVGVLPSLVPEMTKLGTFQPWQHGHGETRYRAASCTAGSVLVMREQHDGSQSWCDACKYG